MREIKFRVYSLDDKEVIKDGATLDDRIDLFVDDGDEITEREGNVIVQYTGVKDKNGKEIYEGDVVNCCSHTGEHNAVIKFGEYIQDGSGGEYLGSICIGFYAEAINKNATDEWGVRKVMEFEETASLYDFREIEVIRNIYEHPHLLGD